MPVRYAVLLRGINVGGHNRVPMSELRAILEARGYGRIETWIASGNVALDADTTDADGLVADVAAAILERFALSIAVVARTHDELRDAIERMPFADHLDEPDKVLLGFAQATIPAGRLRARDGSVDRLEVIGRHVYMFCPNGLGQSKLPDLDRGAGMPVTVRNWRTAQRLLAMTAPRLLAMTAPR